jgi:hypothetical protein
MKRLLIVLIGLVGAAALLTPTAGAASRTCPADGTPSPGSTIRGGLEVGGGVDGYCELRDVTVYGGIHVDATPESFQSQGHWNTVNLIGSRVSGGVTVGDGSEVDTSIELSDFSIATVPSSIDGGLTLDHARFATVANATIRGGLSVQSNTDNTFLCAVLGVPPDFCFSNFAFCHLTIDGNVSEAGINGAQAFLGDPEEQFFANSHCTGNMIHGSVRMTDSNFTRPADGEPSEIEGETVTGSVILDHSTLELGGNTIGGSLLCTNGTVIHPPAPGDVVGNTVRGQDTCN